MVSTKTSQAHCHSMYQENSINIGWGNFPLRTTSPIMWEGIPLCGCKIYHTGIKVLIFQASVFLPSTNYANAHTGCQEPQRDHINSLNVQKKLIHFDLRNTPAHTEFIQWILSIP
jgi:hypothetical protein